MKNKLLITGYLGLFAAILVGVGEYLLHYDPLARFSSEGFNYMRGISASRTSTGHFLGVFGACLYPLGCYHIYLMLRPANRVIAVSALLVGSFGFIVGAVWIGSRASISALMQLPDGPEVQGLIDLYHLRYETLLQVTRMTILLLSLIFIALTMTGDSHYPRWMAIFSPVTLILFSLGTYLIAPQIGKHLAPIALNLGFFIFFSMSVYHARSAKQEVPL